VEVGYRSEVAFVSSELGVGLSGSFVGKGGLQEGAVGLQRLLQIRREELANRIDLLRREGSNFFKSCRRTQTQGQSRCQRQVAGPLFNNIAGLVGWQFILLMKENSTNMKIQTLINQTVLTHSPNLLLITVDVKH
jgi:hypothetical protein